MVSAQRGRSGREARRRSLVDEQVLMSPGSTADAADNSATTRTPSDIARVPIIAA
jgi:hypothetical protein